MSRIVDLINLNPSEPCDFSTIGGEAWYKSQLGELIRRGGRLAFDIVIDEDTGERETIVLVPEDDGMYHWRDSDGDGHWCCFLAETPSHTYLTGNGRGSGGLQGVHILIWPKPEPAEDERIAAAAAIENAHRSPVSEPARKRVQRVPDKPARNRDQKVSRKTARKVSGDPARKVPHKSIRRMQPKAEGKPAKRVRQKPSAKRKR